MKSKIIVTVLVLILISCIVCFADGSLGLSAYVDYRSSEIIINCETSIPYVQRMSVVMVASDVSTPVLTDYIRFNEFSDIEEVLNAKFIFGSDILSGDYKIIVTASGHLSETAEAAINILSITDTTPLLNDINGSNISTIDAFLKKLIPVFSIDEADYNENKKVIAELLLEIKEKDYNGSFKSLQDVSDALNIVDIIRKIKNAQNADSVKQLLENSPSTINIDLTGDDYVKNANLVSSLFYIMNKSYNQGNGVLSGKDINILHKNATALATINTSSTENMEIYIYRYYQILGISSYLADYEKLDKIKIGRQLNSKNFTDMEIFKIEFISAINLLKNQNGNNNTGYSPNSGSGGGNTIKGSVEPPIIDKPKTFTDINDFLWAEESVLALYEMNIINGYEDGQFKGNSTVKREEFVKILVLAFKIYNESAKSEFSDLPKDNWAYLYVSSAAQNGIVNGTDEGDFGLGQEITRQDMAVMLHRASEKLGINYEFVNEQIEFTDFDAISDYAVESVNILQRAGIINGFSDGNFLPDNSLSRAQAAKVIFEALKRK